MVKFKNITWVGTLMTLSQLVLIVFVVQWLFAQYNEKKDALTKDLYRQFIDSKQQAMDSMIVAMLINPVLNGKNGFKVHVMVSDDSTAGKGIQIDQDIRKLVLPPGGFDTSIVSGPFHRSYDKSITLRHAPDPRDNLLLRGVKLIYKEVSSMPNDSDKIDPTFFYQTDSILFKKILAGNLDKSGLKFNTRWMAGEGKDSTGKNKSTIYFESNLFPESYGVEISQYNFYLLRQMTPQFLFAFVLLLLTGAAFLIAYMSLKNQIRLNELRNDFISNISHELKTPVSTVKVAIEALQNFDVMREPKVAGEYLEMAELEMNRLDLLISKVIDTSMLEDGKQLISTERTNLETLVKEVLASLRFRFNQVQAVVTFESTSEELFATVDKLHVQGVLMNLLDNSLKYGKEKPVIKITLGETAYQVVLSVADNGPGIPGEYVNKIFEKFFRIPDGNRHNIKGYGLGLSYSALVMKQHGGTIRLKNLEEGGCTFTLTFPKS